MGITEQTGETREAIRGPGAQALSPAHWDMNELLERVDGDQEFLCELLRIFRDDCEDQIPGARAALQEADLPKLMRAAHTIKGMLKNLAMKQAAEIAYEVETAAREEKREAAAAALCRLEVALAQLLPLVDAHLAAAEVKG